MYQKLLKLAVSRKSYCNNNQQLTLLGPPCIYRALKTAYVCRDLRHAGINDEEDVRRRLRQWHRLAFLFLWQFIFLVIGLNCMRPNKAFKKFLCFRLPSVPKKPVSLKILLDFWKYFISFTNIYVFFKKKCRFSMLIFQHKSTLWSLDGMPKTS